MHLQQVVKILQESKVNRRSEPAKGKVLMSVTEMNYDGPLPNDVAGREYRTAEYPQWILSSESPNNCVVLLNGMIVIIQNFVQTMEGEIRIIGRNFTVAEDFITSPVSSKDHWCVQIA